MLEVVGVNLARRGDLVRDDVVGVLLDLEVDVLVLELGHGEVVQYLGVRRRRGCDRECLCLGGRRARRAGIAAGGEDRGSDEGGRASEEVLAGKHG